MNSFVVEREFIGALAVAPRFSLLVGGFGESVQLARPDWDLPKFAPVCLSVSIGWLQKASQS